MPEFLVLFAFLVVAALYGSVGHGGASGYLAVMTLAAFAPETLRPTALALNLVVSLIGTVLFFRAGHFAWRSFWPFAAASIPFAWLGGSLTLPPAAFKLLLAAALACAALRLLVPAPAAHALRRPPIPLMLAVGALLGLLSGLVGVGGGIFLTPLLLLARWTDPKTAAAVSAPFIFVNSAAALIGLASPAIILAPHWPWIAAAVILGGTLGARWGSHHAAPALLRPALALVLLVACAKLVLP